MASDSPISALQAHVLPVWESLRSKATDPRPAYALSGICTFRANPGAAALPFGFAHATLNARATYKIPRLVPPFWQLAGFGALFATGGYIIGQGDTLNGSGVITGAWFAKRSMVLDVHHLQDAADTALAMEVTHLVGPKHSSLWGWSWRIR